ncbi:hypothetical protein EYF80_002429 [Liparis tanakae]|uniref:Uncharacterized protein n=1 Tax=Liparis tanakae TaxID=230148 RepID=A0A4Z2JB45_9TELE|nr:hypothetical protein EYF80_002429 [Liparis tanakae]
MTSEKILGSSVLLELSCSWSTSLSGSSTMRWLRCGLASLEHRGDRTGDMLWRLLEAGKEVLKTPARDGEEGLFVTSVWGPRLSKPLLAAAIPWMEHGMPCPVGACMVDKLHSPFHILHFGHHPDPFISLVDFTIHLLSGHGCRSSIQNGPAQGIGPLHRANVVPVFSPGQTLHQAAERRLVTQLAVILGEVVVEVDVGVKRPVVLHEVPTLTSDLEGFLHGQDGITGCTDDILTAVMLLASQLLHLSALGRSPLVLWRHRKAAAAEDPTSAVNFRTLHPAELCNGLLRCLLGDEEFVRGAGRLASLFGHGEILLSPVMIPLSVSSPLISMFPVNPELAMWREGDEPPTSYL